jgi:hypothetical protein
LVLGFEVQMMQWQELGLQEGLRFVWVVSVVVVGMLVVLGSRVVLPRY